MKYCGKCTETKPISAFSKNARRKDGLQSQCISCRSEHRKLVKEQISEYKRNWQERNPEYVREYWREYRAREYVRDTRRAEKHKRRKHYSDGDAPRNAWRVLLDFYGEKCMYPECDEADRLQLDHVIPISQRGRHSLDNMQVLCLVHNAQKGNRSCADYRQGRVINAL